MPETANAEGCDEAETDFAFTGGYRFDIACFSQVRGRFAAFFVWGVCGP